MSRDANGTYSLPLAAVVAGTTITSTWANTTMTDVESEFTDSLSRSGKGGMTAPLRVANGTASIPSFSFTNDTGLGFYRKSSAVLGLAVGTADLWTISATVMTLSTKLLMSAHTLIQAKGADVASAAALPVLTDGNYFDVTGTTAITSINTLGIGTVIKLHFDGALTLTHHATNLILPGGTNITTAAGDEAEFVEHASGDWRLTSYLVAANEVAMFESGTDMLFYQTAAPTGWTKNTTASLNDHALRVMTSGAWTGGTQGTTAFSTQFAQNHAGDNYTLLTADVPAHTHGSSGAHDHTYLAPLASPSYSNSTPNTAQGSATSTTGTGNHTHTSIGGGGAHKHNHDLGVKYLDMIIAAKD